MIARGGYISSNLNRSTEVTDQRSRLIQIHEHQHKHTPYRNLSAHNVVQPDDPGHSFLASASVPRLTFLEVDDQ